MKLVTFNIRGDFGIDGENNFDCRKPLILQRIQQQQPDVIGFQEVMPHVQRWLRQNLPGYTVVGCGRKADYSDEAMTLAIRNETAELLGFEVFWLSPTPDQPGSRYAHQSECPRTCAAAIVNVQGMGGPIRIYNTHLDHLDPESRRLGLEQVLRRMEADAARRPMPAVLQGDFNAGPDAPELAALKQKTPPLGLRDITEAFPFTFHNFYRGQEPICKIDYIFVTPELAAGKVERWMDSENGVYLSDHCPICAELWRQPQE